MIQKHMPLVQTLLQYVNQDITRFHMPGHKSGRGFEQEFLDNLAAMDVTEVPGLDNLHNAQGPIDEAQKLAAQAFGADHTWFLVNGSTSGIHGMILGACPPGSSLIVPRNCHKSVLNAMVMGDIRPIYIQPEYDEGRGLVTQISLKSVEKALQENPDTVGVFIVSPSYYGFCPDIQGIARLVHRKNKILLVDEAHGGHLIFNSKLPPSAGEMGADLWVQSAHKTLPSFTQTAYLHVKSEKIDREKISRILSMYQTSSPSYMFMAALDFARHTMVTRGEDLLSQLIYDLQDLRQELKKSLALETLAKSIWPEVPYIDPTRLVLDFNGLGLTGFQAEDILRKEESLQVEMSDHRYCIFICSIADTKKEIDKILQACQNLERNHKKDCHIEIAESISREIPEQIMTPRQAFDNKVQKIPLCKGKGYISADAVGAYPPGIPRYCPGELIEQDGIDELTFIVKSGGILFGVDQDNCINVVRKD